ncbi:hypothetical protein L0128_19420 [candidate division KSB1 bacterium]|nr:hypothetical protein [candidate division KSB1 bacterium]
MERNIIHVNATAFSIQLERLKNPALRKYPLVIAPPDERAVVHAVSDEARQYGIRRGMPLKNVVKLCREARIIPPNEPLYAQAATDMNHILQHLTPIIEPVHYGHTFMDVTGTRRLQGAAVDTGWRAQREIKQRLQLDICLGVASNKLVSQLATYTSTPRGIQQVKAGTEAQFIAPLPVYWLPGVHRTTQEQLTALNIKLIRELAAISLSDLTLVFGRPGLQLHNFAQGIDPRPVQPPEQVPNIVALEILTQDTNELKLLEAILWMLVEKVGRELRQNRLVARKCQVYLRYSDYQEKQARLTFPEPCANELEIYPVARQLFQQAFQRRIRVRQLALKLWDLRPQPRQLSLFTSPPPKPVAKLLPALDHIRARFGPDAIQFAHTLGIKTKMANT